MIREKDLAILLVVMVLFMIFQTGLMLFLDHRVDTLEREIAEAEERAIQREMSLVSEKTDGVTEKTEKTVAADLPNIGEIDVTSIVDLLPKIEENTNLERELEAPYDENYVLRVLTAEAGSDEALCGCVAQCVFNACEKHGWAYTPQEIMCKYGYTSPADWISEAAINAYDAVFLSGVTFTDVGDALYFYAPKYCSSEWHESQRFIAEISGVRFFAEW